MPSTFHIHDPSGQGKGGGGGGKGERGGKRTDEVGVVRRQFVVQLDGVRLVDGVPERGPASNNGVYVFRVGGPVELS